MIEFFQKRFLSRFAALSVPASLLLDFFRGLFEELQRQHLSVCPMKLSSQFPPRNSSDSARAVFCETSLDFASPRFLNFRICGLVEALEKERSQFGPVALRQLRRLLVQVADRVRHSRILATRGGC